MWSRITKWCKFQKVVLAQLRIHQKRWSNSFLYTRTLETTRLENIERNLTGSINSTHTKKRDSSPCAMQCIAMYVCSEDRFAQQSCAQSESLSIYVNKKKYSLSDLNRSARVWASGFEPDVFTNFTKWAKIAYKKRCTLCFALNYKAIQSKAIQSKATQHRIML